MWQCPALEVATVSKGSVRYQRDVNPFGISREISGSHDMVPEPKRKRELGRKRRKRMWLDILLHYTTRKMSDPDDRLSAITGVVEELADRWGDSCIFGIWQSRFIEELAWHNISSYDLRKRSSRAPSWSWASLNSPAVISVGWLCQPVLANVLSISADQREVVLRGPLLVAKEVMPKDFFVSSKTDSPFETIEWDDNEPFPAGHKIHFF